MLKSKSGFTLIEMLSAILILGLLFLLVVPSIISKIKKTTEDIDIATKRIIFSSSEIYIAKNSNDYPKTKGDVYCITIQELVNSKELIPGLIDIKTGQKINYSQIVEIKIENEANITYKLVNQCEEIINEPEGPMYYTDESGANPPILLEGMTPIIWDKNTNDWIMASNIDNPYKQNWYDYENKKWANAKTVDGSYWVWIPRYAYSITSGYHTKTVGTIEIVFLEETSNIPSQELSNFNLGETPLYNGSQQTNYVVHPAFDFSNDGKSNPIEGFWVAKFEPSGDLDNIAILPGEISLISSNIKTFFDKTQNMKEYTCNNNCDTHMMKNTEWGAVTYLSKSIYGANDIIWINNSSTHITGCAGSTAFASGYSGCQNQYDTTIGKKASTTHNIYGIYDMSGGAWEYVMANYKKTTVSSGFSQSELNSLDTKYIDFYTGYNNIIFGDAKYETSLTTKPLDFGYAYVLNDAWYSNRTTKMGNYTIASKSVQAYWLARGDEYSGKEYAGLFSFRPDTGVTSNTYTFRPIMVAL